MNEYPIPDPSEEIGPEDSDSVRPEISRYAVYTDEQIVEMSHSGDSSAEEYLLDKYKNLSAPKPGVIFSWAPIMRISSRRE